MFIYTESKVHSFLGCEKYIYIMCIYLTVIKWLAGGGGGRNFRVMSSFQAAGFQSGMGTAFPSAATFPHYAIQQGIPYNLYGYLFIYN